MVRRDLEVVIVRAQDLERVQFLHSLKPYPVVCIRDGEGNPYAGPGKKKTVDVHGRSNPEWEAMCKFEIDTNEVLQRQLRLIVRLESHRNTILGGKFIGEVRVPIEQLLSAYGDADDRIEVTRDVLNKKGEAQGSLTFTYKFGTTLDHPQPANGNPVAQIPQPANENPVAQIPQPANENPVAQIPQPANENPVAQIPQPANENPVAQIPQRYNVGNQVLQAAVEGGTQGFVSSLGDMLRDYL